MTFFEKKLAHTQNILFYFIWGCRTVNIAGGYIYRFTAKTTQLLFKNAGSTIRVSAAKDDGVDAVYVADTTANVGVRCLFTRFIVDLKYKKILFKFLESVYTN